MRCALYPGTFDPVTNGHISLIERGLDVFDRIIVAVAKDTPKTPLFSLEERVALAKEALAGETRVTVMPYAGLTVEFAEKQHVCALLRGLRAVSDFEYEFQIALMNRRLKKYMQTVFLMTDYKWLYISSTIVKTVAAQGGDISGLVPANVEPILLERLKAHPEASADRPA